jgi:hypothetical protein
MSGTQNLLDPDETCVLTLLADAWNMFVKLPELHPWDRQEFMHAIHDAQRIVLSRPATGDPGWMSEENLRSCTGKMAVTVAEINERFKKDTEKLGKNKPSKGD